MKISSSKGLARFFRKFHTILFFLAVSGSLFVAIFILISTVVKSSEATADSSQAINGTFDEKTIDTIENDLTVQSEPGKRINPFLE